MGHTHTDTNFDEHATKNEGKDSGRSYHKGTAK